MELVALLRDATILLSLMTSSSRALDNGVALTPPMGFLDWERFECNTNCDTDPDNCISERLFMKMADIMAAEGYREAGYKYVCIDDCWLADTRDQNGHLQPDPRRFPSGMKALADYIHSRGLKLGVYEDVGTKTCAGGPGSQGFIDTDAQTFASWGVDLLKFDGCSSTVDNYAYGFPAMAQALNRTGHHIVYSCEWPMYDRAHSVKPDQRLIASTCNMMRQLTDIYDSWQSVIGMIDFFGDDPDNFSAVAGPGAWNDPDQVVIGNYGLSHDQERVQMALYAILASPLLMSVDLRTIRQSSKDILLNRDVIAINQDSLGIQGRRLKEMGKLSVWLKPVNPPGSAAVAFLYTAESGGPAKVTATFSDLGLNNSAGYDVVEVFDGKPMGLFKPNSTFSCYVNPTGVFLIRATLRAAGGRYH